MLHPNLNDITSGAIDLGNNNGNGISDDDAKAIRECVESLRGSATMASDMIQALADILLEPDGKLKDLSDKKGRLKLLDAITNNCAKQDETKVLMFKLLQSIAKVILAKVNAELCDDDRKRIDNLQAHYFKVFLLGIASAILFGFLFVITVYKSWEFNDVKEQHELYYKHQQEIIDFGKYIKSRNPDTFTSWEEVRQRATEDGDN